MIKKLNIIFLSFFFTFFLISSSKANFTQKILYKYKNIETLQFDFTQKIGEKVEFGNCYIKYPLLMKCVYPKKKKNIISNGKKLAIVKKRYKKIYFYPLEKTPLFFLLNKENIISIIKNYEPITIDSQLVRYEVTDNNLNKLNIFFNKKTLNISGWNTTDAYSNEVNFLIRNIQTNTLIDEKIFKIPNENDL